MAEEDKDLLDLIFAAPINLPTVKQTEPGTGTSDEPSKEPHSSQSSQDHASSHRDSVSSDQRSKEAHDKEDRIGIEKGESLNNGEDDFSRLNGTMQDEQSTVIKRLEQAYESERESDISEAGDEPRHEGDFSGQKFDHTSAPSEPSEPSERGSEKADKIADLRSPQIDMLMDEMRHRQQFAENAEEDEEAYEEERYHADDELKKRPLQHQQYIEVDVNIDEEEAPESREAHGSRVQGGFDSASETGSRKESEVHEPAQEHEEAPVFEEKAEAFLEYDRSKAIEAIESIEEPSFGISIDSGPEESDHEPELPKFDEQAGLANAAAIMAQFQKAEPPVPRSRTITEGSTANEQGMRFGELSMDQQLEDHWEQPEPFYNDNVIMKKNEAYSDHGEEPIAMRQSTPYHSQEDFSKQEVEQVPQRRISIRSEDSIGRTQFGSFEPNAAHMIADEVSGARGVSNLKSLFEQAANERPKLPSGHPPEIQYEYEHDFRAHEERRFPQNDYHAPVSTADHFESYERVNRTEMVNEAPVTPPQPEIHVEPEEQKSVNELLSIFGGKKQPTVIRRQSERPSKSEKPQSAYKAETERPVNVVPAVRSRTSSASSATSQSVAKETRPAKLESSRGHEKTEASSTGKRTPLRSPKFSGEDQFQSIRVVKNVRQFVRLWGQSVQTPGSPHPMSPVPANIPDAKEQRILRGIEQQKMTPTPKRKSSTISSIVTNFDANDKGSQYQSKQPVEKRAEKAINKSENRAVSPDHIVSEKDSLNEVMSDGIPVSERRKMFETKTKTAARRSSSLGPNPGKPRRATLPNAEGRRVAEVKAIGRESEQHVEENPKVPSEVSTDAATRDEIKKATEEIANYVTQLTPVAQRRKCFETNTDTGATKRNFVIPAKQAH